MVLDIISLLSDSNAKYVMVPSISLVLSTFLKYYCQNDKYASLSWDLFYWGPNLMTTALLLIFIDYGANNSINEVSVTDKSYGNLMFSSIVVFILMTLLIRKKGWKDNGVGNVRHAHILGIVLPDMLGFLYLYYILSVFSV